MNSIGLGSTYRSNKDHFEQRLGQVVAEQSQDSSPLAPTTFALASLCHVLLNTNEFIYVD